MEKTPEEKVEVEAEKITEEEKICACDGCVKPATK